MDKHYFCKACGIYPFHDTYASPATMGCIDELDTLALAFTLFDGKRL